MEAGQILHNNPVGMEAPDFVEALMVAARSEIARVYWNVNQRPWKGAGSGDIGHIDPWKDREEYLKSSYDPDIPGIEYREYYNWGGSPEDPDWDQAEASKPNFSFEGVEIRWYKYFGRSMNVNVCWSPEKWVRWFERLMQTIRAFESDRPNRHGKPIPYPDPAGIVPLDSTPEDIRYLELMDQVSNLKAQINCMACVCLDVSKGIQPRFTADDWRWCEELKWIVKLGIHALKAPDKFEVFDKDEQ